MIEPSGCSIVYALVLPPVCAAPESVRCVAWVCTAVLKCVHRHARVCAVLESVCHSRSSLSFELMSVILIFLICSFKFWFLMWEECWVGKGMSGWRDSLQAKCRCVFLVHAPSASRCHNFSFRSCFKGCLRIARLQANISVERPEYFSAGDVFQLLLNLGNVGAKLGGRALVSCPWLLVPPLASQKNKMRHT